jgi:hypothetical protein
LQFVDLGNVMAIGSMDTDSKEKVITNHTSSVVSQGLATLNATGGSNSQPTTVTVVSGAGSTQSSKTIVVVPVSNTSQEPAVKRIKTN